MSLRAPFSFFVLGYFLCCCFLLLLFAGMFYTGQDWGCWRYETVQRESLISRQFLHAWNSGQTLGASANFPLPQPVPCLGAPQNVTAELSPACLALQRRKGSCSLAGFVCRECAVWLLLPMRKPRRHHGIILLAFQQKISLELEFGNKNILKAYLRTKIWIPWRVKYVLSVMVCRACRCWDGTR